MYGIIGVFVGGGLGSVLRYLISGKIGSHWGIMLINVLGAMFIGFLFELLEHKVTISAETRALLITGLLGGFTTFSTYILDFGLLLSKRQTAEALVYLSGSIIIGVLGLFGGMRLERWIV